jgi:transcriptional regulator with XRE-family HTH domain
MTTVGERIRAARVEKGLSQTDLASACSVREATVVRWETNRHAPSGRYLANLAIALDRPMAWLIGGDPPAPPERRPTAA